MINASLWFSIPKRPFLEIQRWNLAWNVEALFWYRINYSSIMCRIHDTHSLIFVPEPNESLQNSKINNDKTHMHTWSLFMNTTLVEYFGVNSEQLSLQLATIHDLFRLHKMKYKICLENEVNNYARSTNRIHMMPNGSRFIQQKEKYDNQMYKYWVRQHNENIAGSNVLVRKLTLIFYWESDLRSRIYTVSSF